MGAIGGFGVYFWFGVVKSKLSSSTTGYGLVLDCVRWTDGLDFSMFSLKVFYSSSTFFSFSFLSSSYSCSNVCASDFISSSFS